MEIQRNGNIGWIDLLRVIACFLVVFSHSCDPFIAVFDNDRSTFLTGVFSGSMARCCVPLFVMMTGVLLFPVRSSMSDFYKKRIGRLLIPLIFWSIVLPAIYHLYLHNIASTNNPLIVMDNYTPAATWAKIYTFIFNFNFDTTPFWYLYMLIGLYLIMPILSVWMKQASKKDLELFLKIWGISLILPYLKMVAPLLGYVGNFGNMGVLGICDWNDYGTFYYLSGFIGYLVLAYYLMTYPFTWSWKKTLSITIPMFIIGYLITSIGYVLTQKYFPGNYANLEIVWYFAGINVFMMTFSVFVIVQKIKVTSSVTLSRLASATFGVYLCHFAFLPMVYDFLNTLYPFPTIVSILLVACLTFIVSYLVVRLLECLKLTRRLVM